MKKIKYYKDLDLYDEKILYELDVDARASATKIAEQIRLPKETVNFRIKRLLQNKYISYFYTIINASCFGYQYYKIFLKLNKLTLDIEKKITDFILHEKSCANLRITEGLYDICFVTMHKNPIGLKEFLHRFSKYFGDYILQKSMHLMISSCKLNQKFLYQGKAVRKLFYLGEAGSYLLDKIDLEVIRILSTQARIKLTDVSREIKEDPKVVRYHIKKLEADGVIVGYFSALNLEFFRRLFIQIDISLKDPGSINSILDFFDQTGVSIFASELLGKYDLTVELYVQDDKHLREILYKFKENFLEEYIFYDVSRICREFVVNWSPFDAYLTDTKNGEK
jgi:DNA-binding Lrp family transcriptional regulator